jgi:hypothetical protein
LLVFGHPTDSSIAAMTTKEDAQASLVKDSGKVHDFKSLHMPQLDSHSKQHLDLRDVDAYEKRARYKII